MSVPTPSLSLTREAEGSNQTPINKHKMNITIKTATVTVENREVPLTRAMVNQLEHWQSFRFKPEEIKVVGTVSLPDTVTYLIMTPVGLQRSNHLSPDREGVKDAPRIILTK